jgi:phospholipid N-methyltransferase
METVNKYYKISKSIYSNEVDINGYFEAYKQVKEAEAEIKAELKTKTVKILNSICAQLGQWSDSRDKKEDLINKIFDSLTDYFLIGRNVSYFMGEETHATAKEKLINNTTAETLTNFYTTRREKQTALNKACENPETLQEFRTFIEQRGKDKLSPEQLARFEELTAEITLKRQQQEQEKQNTVFKIENENVQFDLHQTKHSKTGAEIFTVLMLNRVEREEFNALSTKAKKMGGYYSRFTNLRATPPIKAGFNFNTEEEALAFMGLKEENQNTTEKAEAREEEKQQTAGERMRERAQNMIEKAEESLNQERRTNTHRQARQASSSEDKARAEIVFAKKMIKISEGFDNGSIKYLHKIRNGKQLEQLESLLNKGYYNRLRTLNLSYTERQKEEKQPFLDVNFIEYPYPVFYIEMIKSILLPYSESAGMKQAVNKILRGYANKPKDENDKIILKSEHLIELFKKTANKIPQEWEKNRILEPIKDFERLQKMGLTNEAILKTALRELATLTQGAGPSEAEKKAIELKELERSFISKKIEGFFPTPEALINRMFNMAKVFEGETILEPSAGLGHIAEAIRERHPNNKLNVIEYNSQLSEVLKKKGFEVENDDFLKTSKKYDVIFMNPPFERHQDIEHINHAFNLLNAGGRLVCIMAGNKNESSNNKKIVEFLKTVEEYGHIQQNEEGSFKSAFNSTNVNTITVYLEKPEATEEQEQEEERQEQQEERTEVMQCANNNEQLTLFNF